MDKRIYSCPCSFDDKMKLCLFFFRMQNVWHGLGLKANPSLPLVIILLATLFFPSCIQQIPFDTSQFEAELVVNGFLTPNYEANERVKLPASWIYATGRAVTLTPGLVPSLTTDWRCGRETCTPLFIWLTAGPSLSLSQQLPHA